MMIEEWVWIKYWFYGAIFINPIININCHIQIWAVVHLIPSFILKNRIVRLLQWLLCELKTKIVNSLFCHLLTDKVFQPKFLLRKSRKILKFWQLKSMWKNVLSTHQDNSIYSIETTKERGYQYKYKKRVSERVWLIKQFNFWLNEFL